MYCSEDESESVHRKNGNVIVPEMIACPLIMWGCPLMGYNLCQVLSADGVQP